MEIYREKTNHIYKYSFKNPINTASNHTQKCTQLLKQLFTAVNVLHLVKGISKKNITNITLNGY